MSRSQDPESLVLGHGQPSSETSPLNSYYPNANPHQMAKDNFECRYGAKEEKNDEKKEEKQGEDGEEGEEGEKGREEELVPFGTQGRPQKLRSGML